MQKSSPRIQTLFPVNLMVDFRVYLALSGLLLCLSQLEKPTSKDWQDEFDLKDLLAETIFLSGSY